MKKLRLALSMLRDRKYEFIFTGFYLDYVRIEYIENVGFKILTAKQYLHYSLIGPHSENELIDIIRKGQDKSNGTDKHIYIGKKINLTPIPKIT